MMTGKKNNQPLRGLFALVIALAVIFSPGAVFAAETYTFSLEETQDIEISLVYTGSEPSVSVSGPGDAVYAQDGDYAAVERADGVLNLYIRAAEAGEWTIRTDAQVKYTVLKWTPPITVASFTAGAPQEDSVKVRVTVECEEDVYFHWNIYAVSDASATGQPMRVLLRETGGTANRENEADVSVASLPDGEWHMEMDAYAEFDNGMEMDASAAASSTFTVSGHTRTGEGKNVQVVVDLTESVAEFDWSAVEDSFDEMLVSVTDSSGELMMYETYQSDIRQTRVVTDDAGDSLTLRLMPMKDGVFSVQYRLTVPLKPTASVTVETPDATGDLMVKIAYSVGASAVGLEVSLNGSVTNYQLKDAGSLSIRLETMENNEILLKYRVSESLSYRLGKTVTVRTDPPMLTLYGVKDRVVTNEDHITLIGATDVGAALTVNGTAVTLEADGGFSTDVALQDGENSIELVASSPYGVKTVQTVTAIRTDEKAYTGDAPEADAPKKGGLGEYLPLIISVISALACAAATFLTALIARKKGKKLPMILAYIFRTLFAAGTLGFGAAAAYCYYRYRSETLSISDQKLLSLLEAANYDRIAEGLESRDVWMALLTKFMIIAGVCLVLFILLFVIIRYLNGKKKPDDPPAAPGTKPDGPSETPPAKK